jgi:hypothetical protein
MRFYRISRWVLWIVLWLSGSGLFGQVVRLPAVVPLEEPYPGRTVSVPGSPAEVLQAPGETSPPPEISPSEKSDLPAEARPGMFQKLIFDGGWLARGGGSRGLGESDLELKMVLALPCPKPDSPLLITPGFAAHYMDGPAGVEMPPRLYDAYCQFRWLHRFSPQWGVDLAISPNVFSDFQQSRSDAFRLTGYGAAAWTFNPTTQIIFGAGYFNRLDVKVLPIGGIIWTPNEDTSYELLFPRPRLARRVYCCGASGKEVQDWVYLAGEFGGGTWAIARSDGTSDLVDLKDYRILLGAERKVIRGLSAHFELGYVFGRKIQYLSRAPEFDPSDTVMLRGGVTY